MAELTGFPAWIAAHDGTSRLDPEFISLMTRQLHRDDGGRGWVEVRWSFADTSVERCREQQVALVCALWNDMVTRRLTSRCWQSVRLNTFEANDGRLPKEIVGDVSTFKRLHFDPYSIVFAHLYEPTSNLVGGVVSLVDVRGYLDRHGLHLRDAFDPLYLPGHNGRLVARDSHRSRMLAEHAEHVDPPAPGELVLLVVRNDPVAGVAHEIAETRAIDPNAPMTRRFFRASIAPHH